MALTAYKLLKGATQTQLAQAVQLELSLGNRVLVYQPWSRGGYLCQGVGTGTIDNGTVTNYFIITSAVDETFVSLLNTQLPYYQPVGAPIMHNNALYQVMALITAGTGGGGTPGKTPELRVAAGYIQWKYQTDTVWNNLIALSAMAGPSVQLSVNDGYIKWKQSNSEYWETLVSLDSLKGPANTLSVGSVSTVTPSTPASVTITGAAPNQTINFNIPQGASGSNASLTVGTVTALTPGATPTVTITGTAPSQTINFGLPTGATGATGPANTLSIGTVSTGTAAATITGAAPTQTLNLTLPVAPSNSLSIGTVTSGTAAATITGAAPSQTLNLTLPPGPANTLSVGTVTTGAAGSSAAATVTGTAPAQTLNLTIPRGNAGTNSVVESLTGTVVTAGTAVSLTFTKTYTTAPIVVPIPQWNSQQMITGAAITVTTTGCTFLAMQSRGTLLLTSGPFENAAAGQTFKVLVIGN